MARKPKATIKVSPPSAKVSRRDEILAAAVASVVEDGYSRATMSQVARRAGVARPLVQYYFPTRDLMLRAAIGRIMEDWNNDYLESLQDTSEPPSIAVGIDRLWRHMNNTTYRAYQELQSAARTDPALGAIMDELDAAAARQRYNRIAVIYAGYKTADPAAFVDSRVFATVFLEGLLQHKFEPVPEASSVQRQLAMLTELLSGRWSQHEAGSGGATEPSPPPATHRDIVRLAEELITRVKDLAKSER